MNKNIKKNPDSFFWEAGNYSMRIIEHLIKKRKNRTKTSKKKTEKPQDNA